MRLFCAFLLLIGASSCTAQPGPHSLQATVDSLFKKYTPPGTPGVAVLVVKDGQVVLKKGYGLANLEHEAPITPATVFDIASVSKQFAGFAISTLIQEGKLSPDDDIHKYLPEVPDFGKTITIRHLVHHISGLRDWPATLHAAGWRWDESFRYDDIMRMLSKQRELDFEPGSTYSYSNTGYNLLAAIVAKVSGKSYAAWLDEHVFKPLGMQSSQSIEDYSKVIKGMATSYYGNDKEGYYRSNDALTAYGSSSIFTTVEDLAKWVIHFKEAVDRKDPVYLRMLETTTLNDNKQIDYAYGLQVTNNNGLVNVSHDGGWAGFRTTITNYPDQQLSIILLSNDGNFDTYSNALAIAKVFLKDKIKTNAPREDLSSQPTVKADPAVLKKYTGSYRLGDGWYVTFTLENGRMMVQANGEDKFPTDVKSDTVLWVPAYGSSVTFREIGTQAASLKYRGIIAPRVTPVTLSAAALDSCAGTYYSEELETAYRLSVDKGKLTAHHIRLGDFTFEPEMVKAGSFSSNNGKIDFFKDETGKIAGFRLTNGRIKRILFKRQQ